MTTSTNLPVVATVEFHGSQLITIKKDEHELVAMKPVVEGIGLAWLNISIACLAIRTHALPSALTDSIKKTPGYFVGCLFAMKNTPNFSQHYSQYTAWFLVHFVSLWCICVPIIFQVIKIKNP